MKKSEVHVNNAFWEEEAQVRESARWLQYYSVFGKPEAKNSSSLFGEP
jgi:hypothetical protein